MNAFPVAALLTPLGRGAISVIGVSGPGCQEALSRYFTPANSRSGPIASTPLRLAVHRFRYGYWRRADGTREEVIVVRMADQRYEVHCHGGRLVTLALLDDLAHAGCRVVPWQEYLAACGVSPWERTVRQLLSRTRTLQAAATIVDQARGALFHELQQVRGLLQQGLLALATDYLAELRRRGVLAAHLVEPWCVTLLGPPNVGKSSLCNALLGYDRAIVWQEPGTTRDVVAGEFAMEGWVFRLHDTAGVHETENPIEKEGIRRAVAQAAQSDLVILVAAPDVGPWATVELPPHTPSVYVLNKIDLCTENTITSFSPPEKDQYRGTETASPVLLTSTVTGKGIEELRMEIVRRLVKSPIPPGGGAPLTDEQRLLIEQAWHFTQQHQPDAAMEQLDRLLPMTAPFWPEANPQAQGSSNSLP